MRIFVRQLLILCIVGIAVGGEVSVAKPKDPKEDHDEVPYLSSQERPSEVPDFAPKPSLVRLIDDIFQIPIGVLQSVAKLLTNPLIEQRHQNKKNPELKNRRSNQ